MVQIEVGLRRDLGDWTGSWASFLSSPTHVDAFLTSHLGAFGTWINANTQASLFPGLVPLLLVGAAFVKRRARNESQAAVVGAALIAEFAVVPFDVVASPRDIPAADRWLAKQPTPFVVAEILPMDPTIPMLHSMAHWQKTVHGYSGWNPARSQSIAAALASVPDAASLDALSEVGVTYLVVHMSMYSPDEWAVMATRLERASTRLSMRYSDAEGRVYSLAPAVAR